MQGISIREKILSGLIKKKDAGLTNNGSVAIAGLLAMAVYQGYGQSLRWTRNNWKPNREKTRSGHQVKTGRMAMFGVTGAAAGAMGMLSTNLFSSLLFLAHALQERN